MITAHTQPCLARTVEVGSVVGVDECRSLCRFDIDIADAAFSADAIPIDVALVAAYIDTFAITCVDLSAGGTHKEHTGDDALCVVFGASGEFIGHYIERARFIGGIHLALGA